GAEFGPGNQYDFDDYLNREILSRLAPDEQEFLLRTSLLRAISPATAREICGSAGPKLLARVRKHRLPATIRSDGALTHHPCFRQYLVTELHERMPAESVELRRRHARALAVEGDVEEAVENLLDIGEIDDAAEIAAKALEKLYQRGDWALLLRWFERLGDERVEAD